VVANSHPDVSPGAWRCGRKNPPAPGVESHGAEMVCIVCNGKGYIITKDKEMVCPECQGRGELSGFDGGRPATLEPRQCAEAPSPGVLAGSGTAPDLERGISGPC
jgi:hypothetical protein